jgi:hypothetical protein
LVGLIGRGRNWRGIFSPKFETALAQTITEDHGSELIRQLKNASKRVPARLFNGCYFMVAPLLSQQVKTQADRIGQKAHKPFLRGLIVFRPFLLVVWLCWT